MTLNKIYIVVGSTGEYSDHTEWNVAAYTSKEQADLHCVAANKVVEGHTRIIKINPFDSNMQMDYTGTRYFVNEIELFRHFDEFQEQY